MTSNQPKRGQKRPAESNLQDTNQPCSSSHARQTVCNINVHGDNNVTAGGDIHQHNHLYHPQPEPIKSIRLIDKPVPHFTGREKLIKLIHDRLTECATKTDYRERIVVLRGIGGMGKSESARKYVDAYINDPIITNVVWIDAETKESTKSSFKNVAYNLNLDPTDKDAEFLAREFYKHFSEHIKTGLIVFDNVEQLRDKNPYHGILNYLPTQLMDHVPLVLITSRINDWEIPLEGKYIIEISGLEEDAAVAYLYKSLKIAENLTTTEAFRRLSKAIEGYPLGLTLAASTIKSSGSEDITSGVDNYISRLDISKQDWIQDNFSIGAATTYKLLMNAVWNATMEKIKAVEEKDWSFALELLSIMAYFPADGIYKDRILKFYLGILERTESNFDTGMRILKTYSLVSSVIKRKRDAIRIHRHVQRCSRTMLELNNDFSYLSVVARFGKTQKVPLKAKMIKKSLGQWPWSKKDIKALVELFFKLLDEDIAFEMKVCLGKILTVMTDNKEYLMHLYYFASGVLRNGKSQNSLMELLEFDTNEENTFFVAAKAFFKIEDTAVKLKNNMGSRLGLSRLWKQTYFKDNLISRLKGQLKSKFGDILIAFANNSASSYYSEDSITQIYKYFGIYCQDDTCDDAIKYFTAAVRCFSVHGQKTDWKFPCSSLSEKLKSSILCLAYGNSSLWTSFYCLYNCESPKNTNNVLEFGVEEENAFLLAAKVFFNVENGSVNLDAEDKDAVLALSSLWKGLFFNDSLISRLQEHVKSNFGNILCAFSNNSVSERHDYSSMTRIYKYFEIYYQDDACVDALEYFTAAVRCFSVHGEKTRWEFPFREVSEKFKSSIPCAFPNISLLRSYFFLLRFQRHKNTKDVLEFGVEEENAFLLASKAFFEVEDMSPNLDAENSGFRLALSSLWNDLFFVDNLISRLQEHVKSHFGNILCAFSNNSVSERHDYSSMPRIYKYFASYYQDDTCDDALEYFTAAVRCFSLHGEKTNWRLPFRSLSKFFDFEDSNWKTEYQAFVDTFFVEGGAELIVHAVEKYGYLELLPFVIQMTRYRGCTLELVMTVSFMDNLKTRTAKEFKNSTGIYFVDYLLLLLWYGLFSSNGTMRDPNGKEWAITSVAEQMQLFKDKYKNKLEVLTRDIKYYLNDLKYLESILNPYMNSPPGMHDDLTVQTANIMHLIYLCATC